MVYCKRMRQVDVVEQVLSACYAKKEGLLQVLGCLLQVLVSLLQTVYCLLQVLDCYYRLQVECADGASVSDTAGGRGREGADSLLCQEGGQGPMPSHLELIKSVKARFWHWLEPFWVIPSF